MKLNKRWLPMLLALCMLVFLCSTSFAKSYSGDAVFPGLSGIQPGDSLTLPKNTDWATLTASWAVRVSFVNWDETVLNTELVPVTDTTPGSSSAPANPVREGYIFAGWERYDTNDGPATLNDDGTVTGVNGPGPIVFIATYWKPELDVTKESDLNGAQAKPGQTITYTVTVKNTGNVTVTDITVEDELKGAKLLPGESATIASLAPGKSAEVHFSYAVTEKDILEGAIRNIATATGTDPDKGTVTDSGSCEDGTVPANSGIAVTKESDLNGAQAKPGQTITYTVTVKNTGNVTVTDITVEDQLKGARLAAGESDTIASLAPGKSAEVHFTYMVTEKDILEGEIHNVATADGTDPDGNFVDDAGECTDQTEKAAGGIEVTKTSDLNGAHAKPGQTITYTVTVKNTGNVTITDITVEDELKGAKLLPGESDTIASLAPGNSADVHFSYIVTYDDFLEGAIRNIATATGKDPKGETVTADDNCEDGVDPAAGSLTVSKTVTGDLGDKTKYFTFTFTFSADGTFSYTGSKTGTVSNGGTVQLKHGESITIADIPAGTSYTVTESGNKGYRVYKSGSTGTIADGKTTAAKFTNTKSSVPITGESNAMTLGLSLMGTAVIGAAVTLFITGKKRKKAARTENR